MRLFTSQSVLTRVAIVVNRITLLKQKFTLDFVFHSIHFLTSNFNDALVTTSDLIKVI